ncbi:MAG: hypothetical protein AB1633_11720, partial [Elusimicrobiota bacterium]
LSASGVPDGQIKIELGKFNENVDGSGVFKKEDKINPGILTSGEDIGWTFVNPDDSTAQIGASNGFIDTMDVDGNGLFDTFDSPFDGTNGVFTIDMNTEIQNKVTSDNKGWIYITKPITITNVEVWKYVKQIRITIKSPGKTGVVQIAELSVISNRWENLTPNILELSAVSNYDDADYKNNSFIDKMNADYKSIYGEMLLTEEGTTRREQALQLKFTNNISSSDAYAAARINYTRGIDLSTHKKIRFWVYPVGLSQNQLIFRAGNDDNNYFEYSTTTPKTDVWSLVEIYQEDETGDDIPEKWTAATGVITKKGSPSLLNITSFKILLSTSPGQSGKIWINEIYAADPVKRRGQALRGSADLSLPGWFSSGYSYREVDGKFETFIQPIRNQVSYDRSANLNFNNLIQFPELIYFPKGYINTPLNLSGGYSQTKTPFLEKAGELVSFIQQDENLRTYLNSNTSLSLPKWQFLPQFSGSYSITISSISNRPQKIFRTDISQTSNAGASWNLYWLRVTKLDLIDSLWPSNLSVSAGMTTTDIKPWDNPAYNTYISSANPITREISTNYSIQTPWNIWQRLSLNPSYAQTYTRESKYFKSKNKEDFNPDLQYDKSRSQNAGVSLSLRVVRWFNPSG